MSSLQTAIKAISGKATLPVLEGALLEAFDGMLRITCTDLNMGIVTQLEADIAEEGRVVLPGKLLGEIVRKLPVGDVDVSVAPNNAATIRCRGSRTTLAGFAAEEYPPLPALEVNESVTLPQSALRDMIRQTSFSIATEESRPIFTGCLMEVDGGCVNLVALDGFRLAIQKAVMPFELPGGKENVRVVIPGRVLNEMSKVLGDTDEYCTLVFDQSRMTASFGTTTLSTVLLTGEYIDYRKILPASFRTTALADRVGVQNAIDRASLMAREGKNNLIRMSFSGDTLAISSNAELGDVLEELETELTGDPIEIAFNAKYITDVIRNITDEKLCMRFNSNVSPCVIAPQEGEDYLYLILPVRVFT